MADSGCGQFPLWTYIRKFFSEIDCNEDIVRPKLARHELRDKDCFRRYSKFKLTNAPPFKLNQPNMDHGGKQSKL